MVLRIVVSFSSSCGMPKSGSAGGAARRCGSGARRGGGAGAAAAPGLRAFDVGLDDPAVRAAALDASQGRCPCRAAIRLASGEAITRSPAGSPERLSAEPALRFGGRSVGAGRQARPAGGRLRPSRLPAAALRPGAAARSPASSPSPASVAITVPTFTPFGAFGDRRSSAIDAFVDRLEFHRRLVGLDLGHDVARARPCRRP